MKDEGVWSIPKGEFDQSENALEVAKREFAEETGVDLEVSFISLPSIKQTGGKVVHAFAAEGDIDAEGITSNSFEIEWPPKSGKKRSFPEVDRAAWFSIKEAKHKILKSQLPLLDSLLHAINAKRH